jgi:hypothetical protein
MGESLRSSLLSTHEIIGMDDFNISDAHEPKNESQIGLLEIVGRLRRIFDIGTPPWRDNPYLFPLHQSFVTAIGFNAPIWVMGE